MVMWHSSLTPFVTIIPTESPSFQSILLKLPGSVTSVHTVLYLPTAGREDHFITALVDLEAHIDEIRSQHPDAPHFIRGDANVNPNNIARFNLFYFSSSLSLKRLPLCHPTYHHFVRDGNFDSEIDVILYHGKEISETLSEINCKLESPFVESHHDVILSTCSLPSASIPPPHQDLLEAPQDQSIVGSSLTSLRDFCDTKTTAGLYLSFVCHN
jgi:hypothetical protein